MAGLKLLVTGSTGYIGGTILSQLLASSDAAIKGLEVSVLVRGQEKADKLAAKGVKPVFFKDLEDAEGLKKAASEADIVISALNGFHTPSAKALVEGLGERRKTTGKDVYFLHTTGTSDIADKPITKDWIEPRVWSDRDDIFAYEEQRQAAEEYVQRTTDLTVIKTGLELGVRTYLVMAGTVYGLGETEFHNTSIQIPAAIKTALAAGHAHVVADGAQEWDHVHVADMASLFVTLISKLVSGADVPYGKKGYFFPSGGRHTWLDVAKAVGKAGHELGALKTAEPKSITLEEAAGLWGWGSAQIAELGFASRAVTRGDNAAALGWKPTRTDADFEANFLAEFKNILAEQKA